MSFRISGLPLAPFAPLFALDDATLAAQGARRFVCAPGEGMPCRVSLRDAQPGERVILANFDHLPVASPYRARGPVFVREAAEEASFEPDEVPALLRSRPLSLRAYDDADMIVDADVVAGTEFEELLGRLLARPDTAYVHVHYARRGCYAARVERV